MHKMNKQTNRTQGYLTKQFFISIFVCFVVITFLATPTAAAVYRTDLGNVHEHEVNHNKDITIHSQDIDNIGNKIMTKYHYEEYIISFDYTISELFRDGKVFNRLCLVDGGVECGIEGEERQFYCQLINVAGELNSVSVTFLDPMKVQTEPIPYRTPTIIGNNKEVLDQRWEGYLESDVGADWAVQHLSKTTIDNTRGELYSLKIYPVEYHGNGSTILFQKVKVCYYYHSFEYSYWSSSTSGSDVSTVAVSPDPGHKPTGPIKYLIITHSDLADSVRTFATWKAQKGIFTQVVTTDELDEMYDESVGDLQCKMRKYVQQMEQKYDLDYLLLVGDWDKVPTRNTKNSYASPMMGEPNDFATDLYFACVDPNTTWNKDGDSDYAEDGEVDDCVPDMTVGRLAINSPSILTSVLNNLIEREQNLTWEPDNAVAVYMAGDPGYMPGDPTEVLDYFYETYGKDVFSNNITIYYDGSGKLEYTSESVKKVLNDHHAAMCYFGHGQPTGLPELFENGDIASLNSNGTDGSIFAMACLTGWFDDPSNSGMMGAVDNCFAEMLTETPSKGVVGYIGSSRIAVGYIDTVYSDDAPGLEEDYWRSVQEAALGNITPTIGDIWRNAMTNFAGSFFPFKAQGFDNPGLRTFLEYNLLGEPEAPLVFHEPERLNLEFSVNRAQNTIWAKVTNSTGAPVPDATVCIYRADELGRAYNTNTKGEVTFSIPPNNGGLINITASKPGDLPVVDCFILPDNLAPKQMYTINPANPDGDNGYYISSPTIELYGDEYVDVEYRIDDGVTLYTDGSASVQVPNGEHTVKFRVMDRAGQWSDWKELKVVVDHVAPELTVKIDSSDPDGNNGWYISKPVLTLQSNEQLNDSYYMINDDLEQPYNSAIELSEGEYEITFKAFDLAGNMNITKIVLKVDLTAPTTVANVSRPPDGQNGYYTTPPTIKIYPNSEQDGVTTLEYRWENGAWKTYKTAITPPEGTHTLYYRGIDAAGNIESKNSLDFMVDTNTPEVNVNVSPSQPDGLNDYYITHPKVQFDSSDGLVYYYLASATEVGNAGNQNIQWSDIEATEVHDHIYIPEGEWYLYSMAEDLAGNQGFGKTQYFKVDLTPPTLVWDITPETSDGESQWYCSSPTISVQAVNQTEDVLIFWSDEVHNEWTEYSTDSDITLLSGEHVVRFQGIDLAGNIYTTQTQVIKVDLKPPELDITNPAADVTVGRSVLFSWYGTDEHSGIKCFKVRLDEKAWENVYNDISLEMDKLSHGQHKITVRAWDLAGNSIQVRQSFAVDAEGPKINSRSPIGRNVPVNARVTLEFSEQMDYDSVEMTIEGLACKLLWENNTAFAILTHDMAYSTRYTVQVTGSDQYGNEMSTYKWTFETAPEPDRGAEDSASWNPFGSIGMILAGLIFGIIIMVIFIAGFCWYKKKRLNIK